VATYSRVTPAGWSQGDDTSDASRVTPTGWEQVGAAAPPAPTVVLSNLEAVSITSNSATLRCDFDFA
jgi:hypothetical protein